MSFIRRWIYFNLQALFLVGCIPSNNGSENRSLDSFRGEFTCYNRETELYTSVVDIHLYYRPFDGKAIPFDEMNAYLSRTNVRFANVYGIGQMLPAYSPCSDYSKCPGVPVLSMIRNDFFNAENMVASVPDNLHLTLSMTFTDLSNPDSPLR